MTNKKYKIMKSIEDDAPSGDINWCTISFLTPQKLDATKHMDAKGFKIHNGYNTAELANKDARIIKTNKKQHDVYLSQLGKIYAWDDASKTEEIEYENNDLNDLEKKRRENIDKIKLMNEQFKNEYKNLHININENRKLDQIKRMRQKLYEQGKISQKEYEMLEEESKLTKNDEEMSIKLKLMEQEIEECFKTDYLDENTPVALKYGCMTIFSPKNIKGLSTLCFKIRGLFQTQNELNRRVKKLKDMYPDDRIYNFEVGKWIVFSEQDGIDTMKLIKQLNYFMKCYLDNMENETNEFEKRKENLKSRTEQEAKMTKTLNKRERKKAKMEKEKSEKEKQKREKKEKKEKNRKESPDQPKSMPDLTAEDYSLTNNSIDNENIKNIINFLDDPELRDKFAVDKSSMERVKVDIN